MSTRSQATRIESRAPSGHAFLFVEDLAAARGIAEASVRSAHYIAARTARAAGDAFAGGAYLDPANRDRTLTPEGDKWPTEGDPIPRPDKGRPLLRWDPARADVQRYLNPRRNDPRLRDFDWLHHQYVELGRTPAQMAQMLTPVPSRDVVVFSLERIERPDGGTGIPIRTGGNRPALDDWTFDELQSHLAAHGYVLKHAADTADVTPMTLRRAMRRKATETGREFYMGPARRGGNRRRR